MNTDFCPGLIGILDSLNKVDIQDAQKSVQTRFAELSSGWLKIKKVDQDEDTFAGKVLVNDREALPEKTVDIESCGQLGIKNRTIMDLSFHHAAPVAALAQCDMVQLYQGNWDLY